MAYLRAGYLLASRPWKSLAPFEALEVTWRRRGHEDLVRWVQFCSSNASAGDSKSQSPIGMMEIFDVVVPA
jgi:carbonic anhydrase